MTLVQLYGLVAVAVLGLAVHALLARRSLLRRLIAANVIGSAVFLLLVALATRGAVAGRGVDPVPEAMVLTGIVVAVAFTGLAVALIRRVHADTGETALPEDQPPPRPSAAPSPRPDR